MCAFGWLKLDFLVAVQTAPNNSWINPCERLMSIHKWDCSAVSTSQAKSSDDIEATLKSCYSMANIHKEAVSYPLLKSVVADSLVSVMSLVESRFLRLSLKETKFEIGDVATEDDMECLWCFVDMLDNNLCPIPPKRIFQRL